MNDEQIQQLVEKLDVDADGEIDFGLSFHLLNASLSADIYMYTSTGKFGLTDSNFPVKLKSCT